MRRFPPGTRASLLLAAFLVLSLAGCEDDGPRTIQVVFDVVIPTDTSGEAGVAIVGNHAALGDGRPPGLPLTLERDGHFRGSAELPVGESISYNVWLTSPQAEELDEESLPHAPRTFTVGTRASRRQEASVTRWSDPIEATKPPITFVVEVPEHTPVDPEVWISGNQPELGDWNGAGLKLSRRSSDGRYVARAPFATGANLEFKITRGSWDSVEKGPAGEEVSNRTHAVSGPARLDMKVESWRDQVPDKPPPEVLTGNIQYHDVEGTSVGLKNRKLIVYLPPGYDTQTDRRYPVLYMHDGQNLMNARTSFSKVEWGVDEAAQRLIEARQMEPIIIVGIYNTEDRIPEYTQVPTPRYGGGKADDYGRLLLEVVKPLIDSTYRTKPEPQYTGVAGSSLGGLVSMYFGLTRPSTFTRLGVVSPSVWWADRDLVTRVNNLSGKLPLRIWLDIGTNEESNAAESQKMVDDTRALRDALMAKGWGLETDLGYLEVEGGRHKEEAWAARVEQILQFLYPPTAP